MLENEGGVGMDLVPTRPSQMDLQHTDKTGRRGRLTHCFGLCVTFCRQTRRENRKATLNFSVNIRTILTEYYSLFLWRRGSDGG